MLDKKKIILEKFQQIAEISNDPPRLSVKRERGDRRKGPRRFETPRPREHTAGQDNVIAAMKTGNKKIIAAAIQKYLDQIQG